MLYEKFNKLGYKNNQRIFLNSYQIHELLANKCYYIHIFQRKFVLKENNQLII